MLFDSAECRLVGFTLAPGQAVPVHTSASSVIVTVISGDGVFTGAESERALRAGESLHYDPNEPHGMTAGAGGLQFLALITPGPGAPK